MEAVGEQRDHDMIHWMVQIQPLLPLEGVDETSKTASNNTLCNEYVNQLCIQSPVIRSSRELPHVLPVLSDCNH